MKKILSQLFTALNIEERKLIPKFNSDKFGLILRSAINELDWYSYNIRRTKNPTQEQEEEFYLLTIGVTRLIQLSLDARASFDAPVVMFRRDPSITIPVLRIISALGIIEHGRRIAQTASTGLCKIELIAENEFQISLPPYIPDDDYFETAIQTHYKSEYASIFSELLQSNEVKKIQNEVNQKLNELVYPFQTHYIGYGADPILDEYFFSVSLNELMVCEGYDTFHFATLFGGVPYQKYILALTFFIAIFNRHEQFAEALVRKESHIKLENILTISSDTDSFIESIQDALNHFGSRVEGFENASLNDAKLIFEVLSCSRENTSILSPPASALPLIIQCSKQGFIRCLSARHNNPIQFLLDSLRYHFPNDYNKNQQTREISMQKAIKRLLNESFQGLEYKNNIKIKSGTKLLSDIDLVITDTSTGIVLLCQLKHQELYGSDIHAKHIRTLRLKEQVSQWLTSLDQWLSNNDISSVRASLQLPKSFPDIRIFRLIIGKHYCYPLNEITQNSDTLYANWYQFVNSIELANRENATTKSLETLVEILQKIKKLTPVMHLDEPDSEWKIGDLKFIVKQEKNVY